MPWEGVHCSGNGDYEGTLTGEDTWVPLGYRATQAAEETETQLAGASAVTPGPHTLSPAAPGPGVGADLTGPDLSRLPLLGGSWPERWCPCVEPSPFSHRTKAVLA